MFWVEIADDKIVAKGCGPGKTEEQIEVSETIYNQLTRLPADFEVDGEGNIVSVTPAPEPEPIPHPPTPEERLAAVEEALLLLLMEV
jgi:hypothetical protein